MIGAGLPGLPLTADAARSPTVARPLPSDHAQLRAARARWREATRRMRERTVQRRTPSPSAGGAQRAPQAPSVAARVWRGPAACRAVGSYSVTERTGGGAAMGRREGVVVAAGSLDWGSPLPGAPESRQGGSARCTSC